MHLIVDGVLGRSSLPRVNYYRDTNCIAVGSLLNSAGKSYNFDNDILMQGYYYYITLHYIIGISNATYT